MRGAGVCDATAILWTYGLGHMSASDLDSFFGQHLLMGVFPMAPMPLNDHSILPGNVRGPACGHAAAWCGEWECGWGVRVGSAGGECGWGVRVGSAGGECPPLVPCGVRGPACKWTQPPGVVHGSAGTVCPAPGLCGLRRAAPVLVHAVCGVAPGGMGVGYSPLCAQATIDGFYEDHAPLFNATRTATWVLTALPAVVLTPGYAANAFNTADGAVVVVALQTAAGAGDTVGVTVSAVPACGAPAAVAVDALYPGVSGWKRVSVTPAPVDSVTVTVPVPRASVLLRLTCG